MVDSIKYHAVKGIVLLGLRKVALRLISFVGSVFLARLLAPEDFGVYAIVSFIISFLTTFSGVGFGASLIQKKDDPSESDLRTIFTLQQSIVFVLVLGVLTAAPYLADFYRLSEGSVWLIRAMSLSLVLSSLKVIPSVMLQRQLQFNRFVVPEIVETIVFTGLAVGLAWSGFGVWSFVWAALARGLSGVVVVYVLAPWRIGLEVNRRAASELLRFGIPYEINGWIGLILTSVIPVLIGSLYGATAVGYLNWARTMAVYPTELIYVVSAVIFPTYARLQDRPEILRRAIEKTIFFLSAAILPVTAIAMGAWPQIVHFVFTDKWLPALPAFYFFCFNTIFSGMGTVLSQALYASGRAGTMLKLMLLWMILTWGLAVPMTLWLGPIGPALADLCVAAVTLPLPIYLVRRHIGDVHVVANFAPPFVAAFGAGVVTWSIAQSSGNTLIGLGLAMSFGAGIYLFAAFLMMGSVVYRELKGLLAKPAVATLE